MSAHVSTALCSTAQQITTCYYTILAKMTQDIFVSATKYVHIFMKQCLRSNIPIELTIKGEMPNIMDRFLNVLLPFCLVTFI